MSSAKLRTWIKKAAATCIWLYAAPLRMSERMRHYAKDVALASYVDHLYRAVRYMKARSAHSLAGVIVDVGANVGGTVEYFRREFPQTKIIAFEPNPGVMQRLQDVVARAGNAVIRPVALGPNLSTALLQVTANEVSSSLHEVDPEQRRALPSDYAEGFRVTEEVSVQVSTLDQELADVEEVLLLKLDTQGTELEVLEGGALTLDKTHFVLVEMNNHALYRGTCQYFEVDALLRGKGFKLADVIVSYYTDRGVEEYDALYSKG